MIELIKIHNKKFHVDTMIHFIMMSKYPQHRFFSKGTKIKDTKEMREYNKRDASLFSSSSS